MTGQPIPYVARLRAEMVRAVDQHAAARARRRRRRIVGLVVATAVAVLAPLVLAVLLRGAPTPPALAIAREGDAVTVRLVDAAADPDRMTRELEEAGVGAVVVAVPAPPPLVDRWAGGSIGGRTEGVTWIDDVITFPADARDVVLRIGRPEAAGEEAELGGDAFAPGGVLHCSGVETLTPTDADMELRRRRLTARWHLAGTDEVVEDAPAGVFVILEATSQGRSILLEVVSRDDFHPDMYDIPEQDCGR